MLVSELMETDLNKYIEKHRSPPSLYQCMSLAHKIATGMSWIDGVVIHTGDGLGGFQKGFVKRSLRFEAFEYFAWKFGGWAMDKQGNCERFVGVLLLKKEFCSHRVKFVILV